MAVFEYQGSSLAGKKIKGIVEALNSKEARSKLKRQGLVITSIKEKLQAASRGAGGTFSKSKGAKISINELSLLTRQLATLVKANVPLVDSFAALVDQTNNPTLKSVLSDVKTQINEGQSTAKALSYYPKIFDSIYVNMVEAGEASGTLNIVLNRLADFSESNARLESKLKGAMIYPVVMMGIGALALIVMMVKAVPEIAQMFADRGAELPLITRIVIGASNVLMHQWYLLIGGVFLITFLFRKWVGSKAGKRQFDDLSLRAPIFGKLTSMANISRFCSVLSTLLSSGVPLMNCLNIVKNLITNTLIREAVEDATVAVKEGQSLAEPLKKSGMFPPVVTHMIAIGEKSGELEQMLKVIAESYEGQVRDQVDGLTKVLEPLMILVLGVSIGFVVVGMFLPLLDLMNIAQ